MLQRIVFFAFFASVLVVWAGLARAEPRNHHGDQGRTIVSGWVDGYRANVSRRDGFGHDTTWSAGGGLSVARFVVDDFAVGGSLAVIVAHIDDRLHERPARSWTAGTLDLIYHVPLHRRLSLRFWASGGLGWSSAHEVKDERDKASGTLVATRSQHTHLDFVGSFQPQLLIHLTSSLALQFGPGVRVRYPLIGNTSSEPEILLAPGVSYSFGPEPQEPRSTLDDVHRFSARGRDALSFHGSLTSDYGAGVAWVRFIRDGFGLGGYARTSWYEHELGDTLTVGAGLRAMGDIPLSPSTSLLCVVSPGFAWKELDRSPLSDVLRDTLELEGTLAGYFAVHLYEGLVVGLGPELTAHLRVAGESTSNSPYVRGGFSSMLAASF
jgi:hypothetical protein